MASVWRVWVCVERVAVVKRVWMCSRCVADASVAGACASMSSGLTSRHCAHSLHRAFSTATASSTSGLTGQMALSASAEDAPLAMTSY